MTLTPQQALRLSRAAALAKKHANAHTETPNLVFMFSVEALAALIEEVTAPLRKELSDAFLQAEREARQAYSEGQWAERESYGPGH